MTRKTKFLTALVCFIFLGWLISRPVVSIGLPKPYDEPPAAGHKLTAGELNEFLGLWSRIMHGPLKPYIGQISLAAGRTYPRPLVKWLELQDWNVERFFYDEQRLHGLIECVGLQDDIDSNISITKHNGVNLSQIIKDQRRQLKACHFETDELELIKNNFYSVTEVFSGRAVLSAPAD